MESIPVAFYQSSYWRIEYVLAIIIYLHVGLIASFSTYLIIEAG